MKIPEEEIEFESAITVMDEYSNSGYNFEDSSSDDSGYSEEKITASKSSSRLVNTSGGKSLNYSDKKIFEDDYGLSSDGEEIEDLDPTEKYSDDSSDSKSSSSEKIKVTNKKTRKHRKNSLFANPNLVGHDYDTPFYQEEFKYHNDLLISGEEVFTKDSKPVDPQEVIFFLHKVLYFYVNLV